ncbi:MAG: TIGR04211 family SH3 domain-containing protein [Gammaproteobacteria bacterium]|nr:TIGR04211 family SH3 domain-containing protein [Gammaproteobacteria bacterium]
MKRFIAIYITATFALPTFAETQWISDVFTVPLRSGPSNAHRILHRGLPSGTALEVLSVDEVSGFAQVRTLNGTQGWITAQYLVKEPVARERLERANRRVETLERELAARAKRVADLSAEGSDVAAVNETLAAQVLALETELTELKRTAADAIATRSRNEELARLNDRLQSEVAELVDETHSLRDDVQQRGMWIGAALVLAGLVGGALIKARPRRSGWS